jgi:hypothetical protein
LSLLRAFFEGWADKIFCPVRQCRFGQKV